MENSDFNKASNLKAYKDFNDYINIERWNSFYYQLKEIIKLSPKNILEIGPGSNVLKNILNEYNIEYKSADVDKKTEPDYLLDIRNLSSIDEKFDVVVAFQILEHLPYKYFLPNLKELDKVSKKYVLISLPVNGISYRLNLKLSKYINLDRSGKIPFLNTKLYKEHYWEINHNYTLKTIRNDINKVFNINHEYQCKENPYHYFFILEKKTVDPKP
ncbi:hypothetical protein [Methanococcus maripaludis]|uniref:2-polyprenyl-3-methyl-5-hydroxy-6-metoxy-1, 4-benzoquinol methylase n=1 Tax=Methanococcus maripaludis TaxID=39152 RepID=A0A7J9PAP1_METMI|nr:hypothetical protein [Methanococcus maripaludis]MBA2859848.1 2-polyprenyl-3-methyl-5-hydroxy-6-metoxy-1,4-benzoquinol methylase [Methanococcus maripaludis]